MAPLPQATVEIRQADTQGRYKHPKWPGQEGLDPNFAYFGKVESGKDGTHLLKTIIPRFYHVSTMFSE